MNDGFDDVRDIYRTQGVGGGSVGFGSKAVVLVVDLQHIYTRGRCATGLEAVEAVVPVLDAARAAGVEVVYTYVGYDPDEPDGGVWVEKCPGLLENVRGTQACEIDDLVRPHEGEVVIEKRAASAFFGTGLAERLHAEGVDTVILCGSSTSGCIRATVVDGVAHDLRMVVPVECVSDRSQPSHDAALFDIASKYGDVVGRDEVLAQLAAWGEARS